MDPHTGDVTRCDLCKTAEVHVHCDTCIVNLCKVCVGEHVSTDESIDHKIVKFQARKSLSLSPVCTAHKKKRCEMYCTKCDIPVCITCIASDQHLGHKLLQTAQFLKEKKEKMIEEKRELNESIFPTYQHIASDVQNRMSQLEKEYGDLSTAIKKHGEEWHREIDKLMNKLQTEADELKNMQLQILQKHLDDVNKKISDIKDEINSIQATLDSDDSSVVLDAVFRIEDYRTVPHKIIVSLPKFNMKKFHEELFGTLSSIPSTSEEHGYSLKKMQKPIKVRKLLDEPEIVTTIDSGYVDLCNVACQNDEEIWTSGYGKTMKLFSINRGSLLTKITTKSGNTPTDIAVTDSEELVYADCSDNSVNVLKNGEIEEVIRLQKWSPRGICGTSSGDLLVSMENDDFTQSKVVRYSDSTEKQTIQFDFKGLPFYSFTNNTKYISENRNLDICVADYIAGAIVVVSQAGKLRFRYTGHTPAPKNKPFHPVGITTDSQSHILTADYNNDCVHIIDQDGQFIRYINCGLKYPYGLCIDSNDNLFVAQYKKSQVKKIKYLQ
ncbi:uncharacterized protein LOC133177242 [Saccostrea echinata]|uniref:uncharacterized protein LOC133177242 n=1 Tax=Saccostrea echinata TaxID=191078 RepID=UPI002A7F0E2E|nr:uncharacterized protein LOC133177242 [Saccostrea echinata]